MPAIPHKLLSTQGTSDLVKLPWYSYTVLRLIRYLVRYEFSCVAQNLEWELQFTEGRNIMSIEITESKFNKIFATQYKQTDICASDTLK
jgi:hypothetical protein